MKTILLVTLALVVAACGFSQAQSAGKKDVPGSDRERLIGAWRLASITGPDGNPVMTGVPVGMLIYTRDGHMSVQLMYSKSASALSNEYVRNGYEASFGSFDMNEANHTVTHHVQGSNTGELLVGKDLPRVYQFATERRLIIKPVRPDEHWSVAWERY
jgi:hypothetical protein